MWIFLSIFFRSSFLLKPLTSILLHTQKKFPTRNAHIHTPYFESWLLVIFCCTLPRLLSEYNDFIFPLGVFYRRISQVFLWMQSNMQQQLWFLGQQFHQAHLVTLSCSMASLVQFIYLSKRDSWTHIVGIRDERWRKEEKGERKEWEQMNISIQHDAKVQIRMLNHLGCFDKKVIQKNNKMIGNEQIGILRTVFSYMSQHLPKCLWAISLPATNIWSLILGVSRIMELSPRCVTNGTLLFSLSAWPEDILLLHPLNLWF